jgi:hypothetical protein
MYDVFSSRHMVTLNPFTVTSSVPHELTIDRKKAQNGKINELYRKGTFWDRLLGGFVLGVIFSWWNKNLKYFFNQL